MSGATDSTDPDKRRLPWTFRPGGGFVLLRSGWGLAALAAIVLVVAGLSPVSFGLWWIAPRAAVAAIVLILWAIIAWRCERYALTEAQAVWESGVFRRLRVEMPLDRVQNTVLYRSIGERLLGLGTLGLASAGTDGYEVVWRAVERPDEMLAVLRGAIARARSARHVGGAVASPVAKDLSMTSGEPSRGTPSVLPVIGLAGGVGSGKSTVARLLGELGCLVIDSDQRARAALDRPDVRTKLVEWWGEGVLGADGRVDRSKIAKIVFADEGERAKLEGVVHPIVRQDRAAMIAEAAGREYRAVVIDAPLLFEAGLDRECDAVIFVDVARDERLRRVRAGRGWDEQELARREAAQIRLEEKRARSTHVVSNMGDQAGLQAELRRVLDAVVGPANA